MHDVHAHEPRLGDAHERVEVGAVAVEVRALVVHDPGDVEDPILEDAERVGDREHERRDVVGHRGLEYRQIDRAAGVRLQLAHLVAREVRRRRIRPVRRVGDEDGRPGAARLLQGLAHHENAGELALGSGRRLQRDAGEPGQLGEDALEPPGQLQGALGHRLRSEGVRRREARQARHLFVRPRVVLHGAGAQRIEALVDREIQAREPREVAGDLDLGDLGLAGDLAAAQALGDRDRRRHVQRRQRVADLPLARAFEDQRLGARLGARIHGRGGLLLDLDAHARSLGQRGHEMVHLGPRVHLGHGHEESPSRSAGVRNARAGCRPGSSGPRADRGARPRRRSAGLRRRTR